MREVVIQLTVEQETLLKQFIQTDTLATNRPIFIVQERVYEGQCRWWKNVAFFFSLEEAWRYMKYQSPNLRRPRIYAQSPGYGNYGDWEPFYDLLTSIGQAL